MRRSNDRCRGSVYIVVLGAAMLITVIGVSGIMLQQAQRRAVVANHQITRARLGAHTAMELALLRLSRNANWRSTYSANVWTNAQALPESGTFKFRFRDLADNNLANDSWQNVQIEVQCTVGVATRYFHCTYVPTLVTANLVDNGGIEQPLGRWATFAGTIDRRTDGPHGHTYYLAARNRTSIASAVQQDVTARITAGRTYRLEAWVRARGGLVDTHRIGVRIANSGGSTFDFPLTAASISNTWVKLSGVITPTWTGTLVEAKFYADTLLTTQDFDIDDIVLIDASLPPLLPVRGTFAQQVN